MNDMKNIKEILSDFEVSYDHNDWIKLEKDLPKSPGMSGLTKTILVATAVLLTVSGIYLLNKFDKNTDNNKENVAEKNIVTPQVNQVANNAEDITDNSYINSVVNSNVTNLKSEIINIDNNQNVIADDSQNKDESLTKTETNNTENITAANNKNNSNVNSNELAPNLNNVKFSIKILESCIPAKVIFSAENVPANCELIWNTDENYRVYGNDAEHTYLEAGKYQPEVLIVYNNYVLKTEKLKEISINKANDIKINFDNSENLYYFTCNNVEDLRFLWSIDNQQFSEKEVSYNFKRADEYIIGLKVVNEFGCKSEATEKINIIVEHVYYVPNAFMPNANGINSSFGPIGENMDFVSYKLIIVDGNGNSVFNSESPESMWNGRVNNIGDEARPGFYLWEIKTLDKFGNVQTKKGRVNLIRN